MGKRITVRRRGKAGPQYRAPSKGKIAAARYPFVPAAPRLEGRVVQLLHERGRTTPLMHVLLGGGHTAYLPAIQGVTEGQRIEIGPDANVQPGNVLPLHKIPEGTTICNIERHYGDGGKLVRASGSSATLFSRSPSGAVIRFPSGRTTLLAGACRATIGGIANAGRTEKPFLKAGTRYHLLRARGKLGVYPRVRGIAMAAVHHPFGGGRHQHPGKSTSTARGAPPGRKVGLIAPRKTGRKRLARASRGA